MAGERSRSGLAVAVERFGRGTIRGIEEWGYAAALLAESLHWILLGAFKGQPVRVSAIFSRMMSIGIRAIPIVAAMAFVIGVMLAIQGIYSLKAFGAESQVVVGIALSVTREFAPMITGILVAGRSGSALAAEIGTKQITQEVDALRVIGINPVRYMVAPALVAMMIMLPCLTFLADLMGLLGGAVYSSLELGMSVSAYMDQTIQVLEVDDIWQGLIKSVVFAFIITLVGVSNGFSVQAGAEGVGRATTRAVVMSITYIIIADMIFTFFLTR
ncbi:MAG: ABC transporter permease [Gammaproteobacteria bacterium]|nr:ABC transporter permease [Gammaproteobacteria bacterium]